MRSICVLVLCALAGCADKPPAGGPGGAPTSADALNEVASVLRLYSGKANRGPAKVADLAEYEAGHPLALAAVRKGEIVIVWGATMAGEGDTGGAAEVVAYEKAAPADGGAVLLQNGQVKQLTAAEFASAPKAAGKK